MQRPPIRAIAALAVSSVALAFAACASGGKPMPASAASALPSPSASSDAAITHLLSRMTFGPTPSDVAAVRRVGVEAFLERQMRPEQIDDGALDRRLASFETLQLGSKAIAEQYFQPAIDARRARQAATTQAQKAATAPTTPPPPTPAEQEAFRRERVVLQELSSQKVLRAVYSERQFQEVLVDFWFNHFNVFAGKGADRGLVGAYERDVIRPHVFGTFRDLLGATAQSPAMLFYLDNWMSVDPNGPHPVGRPANTLPLGARIRNGGLLNPLLVRPAPQAAAKKAANRGLNENYARELMELHTLGVDGGYTQRDVVEVARAFTGWTIAAPRDGGEFRFDARQHDPEQKVVLGHIIRAGGGKEDGDRVLDLLAASPATARFIATKLVRRFVADDPPPALVDRVARRFRETGGDLREVYRAIFLSREFRAEAAYTAKVKSPFEFVVSALRATGAEIADATVVVQTVRTLGMPLYGCQTPNGYGDTAATWVNTGALLNRMNVALALADNRLAGVRVDLATLAGSTDPRSARAAIPARLLDTHASPATQAALDKAATLPQLAALTLGSPEFQRR